MGLGGRPGTADSVASTQDADALEDSVAGQAIGPYRVLQKLGEGGMGEVWLAQQERPVRRKVALKLIKIGMDTRQVIARFESERQALALMNHPNIARVFDAGATEQGRPYFAMEYVEGVPITSYCDRHRLPMQERLDLYLSVCEGVQHAHHKGVIHRDIKPSNVLVKFQDDKPVPKIIDFGVAKAIEQRLTEKTVFTQLGAMVGTPEYMSPEQAEMTGLDVDTRTDVYALGVMLYELLTGALPFDSKQLRQAGFDEIRRRIREDEPSKPSARLSTLGGASTESASRRQSDPASLARLLRGDLDWITMHALEKDRTRRYGSPQELAADIRRHLGHEPVLAGPPSTAYRMGKFVRRHRLGVAAAGAVFVALVLGLSAATYGLLRAVRAETQARQEATTSEHVSEFLVGLFEVSDPGLALGETITAREILDKGARKLDVQLEDEPAIRARLLDTIGRVYGNLGLFDDSVRLFEQAVDLNARAWGEDAMQTAHSAHNLGSAYRLRGRFEESERLIRRAIAIKEATVGRDDPDVAASLAQLASLYYAQSRLDEAEEQYLEAIDIYETAAEVDPAAFALALNSLANTYHQLGRFEESEATFQRALEMYESALGTDHPDVAMTLSNLGGLYNSQARYEDAERVQRRSLQIRERTLDPSHFQLAVSFHNLAITYAYQSKLEEAEKLMQRGLSITETALGPDNIRVSLVLNDFALIRQQRGDYAGAESLMRRALKIKEQVLGPENPQVALTSANLAALCEEQGRYEESEALYLRALDIERENPGMNHPRTGMTLHNLANLYRVQGDYGTAEPLYDQALEIWEKALGPDHPNTALVLGNLEILYSKTGREPESRQSFERAASIREEVFGPRHPAVASVFYNWACMIALQDRTDEALDLLREAMDRGYANLLIAEDPDLASLHGHPDFEAMVAEVKQRIGGTGAAH